MIVLVSSFVNSFTLFSHLFFCLLRPRNSVMSYHDMTRTTYLVMLDHLCGTAGNSEDKWAMWDCTGDVVCLPLEWLHVPACRPAPQLLLYTAAMSAVNHWASRWMLRLLQLLQQRGGSGVLLRNQREGSQDVVIKVLSSAAKPFKELSTSGCCHLSVSLRHSLFQSEEPLLQEFGWWKWSRLKIPLAKAARVCLFCFVLIGIISPSTPLSP